MIPADTGAIGGIDRPKSGSNHDARHHDYCGGKKATETVPIIGVGISDPVGFGLVASLAHPEENVTGLLSAIDRLVPKQLELLLQVAPSATRVGVMFNANNPANVAGARLLQTDKPARAIKLFPIELRSSTDIEAAFQVLAGERAEAAVWSSKMAYFCSMPRRLRRRLLKHECRLFSRFSRARRGGGSD